MTKRPPLRRIPPHILRRSRDLRHPLTPAETRLWQQVRDHKLGVHIRRQHVLLGRFVADFRLGDMLCLSCRPARAPGPNLSFP